MAPIETSSEQAEWVEICKTALKIVDPGAVNPVAIAGELHRALKAGLSRGKAAKENAPARLIVSQLVMLMGLLETTLDLGLDWNSAYEECLKVVAENSEEDDGDDAGASRESAP